ncbi:MAG: PqqD family protein [Solirubrobacteraceae bacterium]
MIDRETSLQIASEGVGAKVIDGEAIVINVSTGRYHSIDGPGAIAWELLAAGHTSGQAASALSSRYEVSPDRALADVLELAADLVEQQLLRPGDGPSPGDAPGGEEGPAPYATFELVTFTDIEELLALDPPIPLADVTWEVEGERGR